MQRDWSSQRWPKARSANEWVVAGGAKINSSSNAELQPVRETHPNPFADVLIKAFTIVYVAVPTNSFKLKENIYSQNTYLTGIVHV